METFKIVRHFQRDPGMGRHLEISTRTILTRLSLEEAQAHCSDPETSSSTCTGAAARRRTRERGKWFDGYTAE